MARTLDEYRKNSKRAKSEAVLRKQAVFERALTIGRQVAGLREKHPLTQHELSEKSGIPPADISWIERCVIAPRSDTLTRLAEALGADWRLIEHDPA